MIRKLLPVLLALMGLAGGVSAGLFLRPSEEGHSPASGEHAATPEADSEGDGHSKETATETDEHGAVEEEPGHDAEGEGGPEYVKMNNQFVVPVVKEGRVNAMVVLTISLEVEPGNSEAVYQREPKLRDAFLQVMFDHANSGGFSGSFTDSANLVTLRTNLKESAAMILGTTVRDVLITDIARQDN